MYHRISAKKKKKNILFSQVIRPELDYSCKHTRYILHIQTEIFYQNFVSYSGFCLTNIEYFVILVVVVVFLSLISFKIQ